MADLALPDALLSAGKLAAGARPILAALSFGIFGAAAAWTILPPTRRLGTRVRPYTAVLQIRPSHDADVPAVAAPGASASASALRANDHRMRRLAIAALWTLAGAASGIALGRSPGLVLVISFVGLIIGVTRGRAGIDRAVAARKDRIRAELSTINQLLAMHFRVGSGVVPAVQSIVQGGSGIVVDELTELLRLIDEGLKPSEAFARAAAAAPEHQFARTYQVLARGQERGADLSAGLLALSENIRNARHEDLRRSATLRRAALLIATIVLLGPVMLLLLIASILAFIGGVP